MLENISEVALARAYALEYLLRQRLAAQAERAPQPPRRRLRRALAWTLNRSGQALSRAGERLAA